MNDEIREPLHHFDPMPDTSAQRAIPLKRILSSIPPRPDEATGTLDEAAIGIAATVAASKRSEARRDAILAVCLAITRRGQNPAMDWSTRDTDTAYAIADQLIELGNIT